MRTAITWTFILLLATAGLSTGQEKAQFPGQKEKGFLLPNGWTITPAGDQVLLTDLPLNILPLPTTKHALVATSGYNAHELSIVDLDAKQKGANRDRAAKLVRPGVSPMGDKLWWSGGGAACCTRSCLKDGKLDAGRRRRSDAQRQRRQPQAKLPQRPGARRQEEHALLARHRRRQADRHRSGGPRRRAARSTLGGRPYDVGHRPQRLAAVRLRLGRPHRAGRRSRPTCASWPRSPSASIPIRSRCIPRTTGCSSPAPRATACR